MEARHKLTVQFHLIAAGGGGNLLNGFFRKERQSLHKKLVEVLYIYKRVEWTVPV